MNSTAFDEFWAKYPRKEGKLAAQREWKRVNPTPEVIAQMTAALTWQCEAWDDPQFIPHPRTWLHQGRWMDEPRGPATARGKTSGNVAALQAFARRGQI